MARGAAAEPLADGLPEGAPAGEGGAAADPGGRTEEALLAAPLLAGDGTPIGLVRIAAMPFLSLTEASSRLLAMLARWASAPAERVLLGKSQGDRTIYDEAVGALRYGYFVERLSDEFERATRYSEPLSVVLLEVLGWGAIPPALRETVRRAVAQSLKSAVRAVDGTYLYKDDRSFAVMLPHTGPSGAEKARDRMIQALERLAIEPYRRPGRLEIAVGLGWRTEEMRSPADLMAAAESRAASPIPREPAPVAAAAAAPASGGQADASPVPERSETPPP